jgi:hypothetical protein
LLVGVGALVWVASHREVGRAGRDEQVGARARCVCIHDQR